MAEIQQSPAPSSAHASFLQRVKNAVGASRGSLLVNQVNFGDGIAYFGMLALMTLFMEKNVGFSAGLSTIAVSTFTGLVTLTMIVGAGALSDYLGARRALTLAMTITLVGRLLLVGSPHAGTATLVGVVAWASIIVMSFGEGVLQPALYAGVKEYSPPGSATMGYAWLYAIMNLGIVAGELLSPVIREAYATSVEGIDVQEVPTAGISGAYWFFILVTALVIVVNLLFFTRKVEDRDRVVRPEELAKDEHSTGAGGDGTGGSFIAKLVSLPIFDVRFLFFIFILLPVRTLFAHQWLTMPSYVTRAFPPEVGAKWEWVNGINPFIIVIAVPAIAAITQKRRVVDMMIIGTAVSSVATFLLLPAPNLWLLIGYVVVFSLGEALWSSRFLEYVASVAPANRIGIYMGLAGLPWFLAKSVTGLYAGVMVDRFVPETGTQSPGTMWLIHGLVAIISPIGLILARRWLVAGETDGGEAPAAATAS